MALKLEERFGVDVEKAACMRPHQRLWPQIKHWLEGHRGAQPLPVCTLCADEVLVRGIDPSPSVSGPFVAPSAADEAAAAEAINMKRAKLKAEEVARAARAVKAAMAYGYLRKEPEEEGRPKLKAVEALKWGETEW
jgi:hypothetical protein